MFLTKIDKSSFSL